MAVTLDGSVLDRYRRFSLYNSPYPAHDRGRAIDLYPVGERGPSPVDGEVIDTREVRAPPKPYAAETDHLLVVDTGDRLARIMHVDPTVAPGDRIHRGDDLGRLVRAGFFAPWVPNHLHLGFRSYGDDPYRASGSLPIAIDIPIHGLEWDGTGSVAAAGNTWARLDAPAHPTPGECFVGLASDGGVLDGGFPHYDGGGLVGGGGVAEIAGSPVGIADGRHVQWADARVLANGDPIGGIALFCARDTFGVKLIGEDIGLAVGDGVVVEVETDESGCADCR